MKKFAEIKNYIITAVVSLLVSCLCIFFSTPRENGTSIIGGVKDYAYEVYRDRTELHYQGAKDALVDVVDAYIDSIAPGSGLNGIRLVEVCDEYDVLDKDGNIIYSYKKDDNKNRLEGKINLLVEEDTIEEPEILTSKEEEEPNLPAENIDEEPVEEYPILAPITREELYDEYRDENVDGTILGMIFSDEEIIEMYKNNKASVKIFTLLSTEKRKQEMQ